jgi:hypothetical protein
MVRETVSIEARALASHGRIRIRLPLRQHGIERRRRSDRSRNAASTTMKRCTWNVVTRVCVYLPIYPVRLISYIELERRLHVALP